LGGAEKERGGFWTAAGVDGLALRVARSSALLGLPCATVLVLETRDAADTTGVEEPQGPALPRGKGELVDKGKTA